MNTFRPLLAMLACLLLVACATHRPAGDASAAGGVVVDAPAQVAQDDTLLPATPADAGSEAAPVTAPVSVTREGSSLVFHGSLSISRTQYGIGVGEWQDTSIVADNVVVRFHIVSPQP